MTLPAPGSRTVLLTGASAGLGRETALRPARLGSVTRRMVDDRVRALTGR